MIHKTNSFKSENSFVNKKELSFKNENLSNLGKDNFLKKFIPHKSADFSKQNKEEKEKNQNDNKKKIIIKTINDLMILDEENKINEKNNNKSTIINKENIIEKKKEYNNYIPKSEFNSEYKNNESINNNDLLINYYGKEDLSLRLHTLNNHEINNNNQSNHIDNIIDNKNENKVIQNNNFIIFNQNLTNTNYYYLTYQNKIQYHLLQQQKYLTLLNNKFKNLKNPSLLIKDQMGCRYLQKVIDDNPEISNNLFQMLINNIESMCTDLFGNYVIQKLIIYLNSTNFEKFTRIILKKFRHISTSNYGTRVIQKLIEIISYKNNYFMNNKEQIPTYLKCFSLINSIIINNIHYIFKDNNSCHIIIKFVNVIPYPANDYLYNEIYKYFIILCKDKHGCCVIQKCFENGINQQKLNLFSLSNKYCDELINDQFGNYVIQYVVGCNVDIVNKKLLNLIMNNLLSLCTEKYASNVIEKFIYFNSPESRIFLNKIISDNNILFQIITNQYGNYIIQRIINTIDRETRIKVLKTILCWIDDIKKLSFGPKLLSKLCERYKEFNILINNNFGKEINLYTEINNNYNYNNNMNNNSSMTNSKFENLNIFLMNNYLISSDYSDKNINLNHNINNDNNSINDINNQEKLNYIIDTKLNTINFNNLQSNNNNLYPKFENSNYFVKYIKEQK